MGHANHDNYVKQPFLGQRNFTRLEGEDRQPQERPVQALAQPPPIASTRPRPVYRDSFRGRPLRLGPEPPTIPVPSDSSRPSRGRGAPAPRVYFRGHAPGPTNQQPIRYSGPSNNDYGLGQHLAKPHIANSRREYGSISHSHYNRDHVSGNNSRLDTPNVASNAFSVSNASSTSLSSRHTDKKPYPMVTHALDISHASSSSARPEGDSDNYFRRQPMDEPLSDSRHSAVVAPWLPSLRSGDHLSSSLQPPVKRRKTTPTPPQPPSKQKAEEIVDPVPAHDASRGTLFVAMIDSCRRRPDCDLAQVNANRKRWKLDYSKKLLDEGREVEKIYIRDDGMAIDWRLRVNEPGMIDLTHSSPTQSRPSSPTSQNAPHKHSQYSIQSSSSSQAVSLSSDTSTDRLHVILPVHTHGDKTLRKAWVSGHIQFLRSQQQSLGKTLKRWYYVKEKTEMIVELYPMPSSRAGKKVNSESSMPAVASVAAASGAPNQALGRELDSTRYSPSQPILQDSNATPCVLTPQPSSPSPCIKQETISDLIVSTTPKPVASGASGGADASDSLPAQSNARPRTGRSIVKNLAPLYGRTSNPLPERVLASSPGLRQGVSTSTLSTAATGGVAEDIGNIMRIVTPTSHQLIALSDGVAGPVLISKRYVMNIAKRGVIEFVFRSPPRAIVPEWVLPPQRAEGINPVNDAAMILGPFEDQAVIAYSDPDMQVSIVDFRSDLTVPSHYYFQQCPHRSSGPKSICTLPSTLASDVGINFVTGGADRNVYHWKYDGQIMQTSRFNIGHKATVHSLAYCKDSARLYTGGDDAVLSAYDIENDAVSGCVIAPNPVRHVHAQSPNVMLVEVEDRGMQFQIHDWRSPRIVQRFGFLDNTLASTPLKGDVRGHFFVRGDASGNIRLWDTRNLDGYQTISVCPGYSVGQVLFDSFEVGHDRLISSLEDNRLAFSSFLRGR